jgi:predicted alpha/beta hydrolase
MSRVFSLAVLAALVHALDDAFVHRGPGLGLDQHALAGLLALVAAGAAIVAFPRLRPGLQSALALSFGVVALVNGAMHLHHPIATGLLALAAGVTLLGLAAVIPWRRRGLGTWRSRSVAVAAGLLGGLCVLGPAAMGIVSVHKWRDPIGAPPSAAYSNVHFQASDGLDLAGWYRPSRTGAAIVLVHGGGGDRVGSVAHAQLLARHGYGVLLYDARGRGESDGSPNDYGWDWAKDVDGALAFLKSRPDVDPGRIGALGLSTGADVLVDVAGDRHDIAAVVADGTAAGSFDDWARLRGTELGTVPGWMMFTTIRVLSGDPPGRPLADQIRKITAPTLLISAGTAEEREFSDLYERAAAGRVEHWNLPDAHHTHAIREHPEEYERRVVGFFDAALSRKER